jgi:phosphoribosylaminoimidazolecarboxamide formyltransferase / IMP cyclohydrolase
LLEAIGKLFVEVLVARSFTNDALEWLSNKKKNCRVMRVKHDVPKDLVIRSVFGGVLVQTGDNTGVKFDDWKVVSKKQPTEEQMKELAFAWLAVKHVKSNAIVLVRGTATVGVGCGQPNRLDSVRTAGIHAAEKAKDSVLASDAFFPFADGIEAAAAVGAVAVVQPGGSMRDNEVIEAADRLGLVMIFTGERHFKH